MEKAIDPSPHDILQESQRSNTRVTTIHDRREVSACAQLQRRRTFARLRIVMLSLITYTEVVTILTYWSHGSEGFIGQLPRPIADVFRQDIDSRMPLYDPEPHAAEARTVKILL
jgi:hypothetical protein